MTGLIIFFAVKGRPGPGTPTSPLWFGSACVSAWSSGVHVPMPFQRHPVYAEEREAIYPSAHRHAGRYAGQVGSHSQVCKVERCLTTILACMLRTLIHTPYRVLPPSPDGYLLPRPFPGARLRQ